MGALCLGPAHVFLALAHLPVQSRGGGRGHGSYCLRLVACLAHDQIHEIEVPDCKAYEAGHEKTCKNPYPGPVAPGPCCPFRSVDRGVVFLGWGKEVQHRLAGFAFDLQKLCVGAQKAPCVGLVGKELVPALLYGLERVFSQLQSIGSVCKGKAPGLAGRAQECAKGRGIGRCRRNSWLSCWRSLVPCRDSIFLRALGRCFFHALICGLLVSDPLFLRHIGVLFLKLHGLFPRGLCQCPLCIPFGKGTFSPLSLNEPKREQSVLFPLVLSPGERLIGVCL